MPGTVVNGVRDAVAVILEIIESAQHEIEFLSAPSFLSFAGTYATVESAKHFIENGGVIRGIVPYRVRTSTAYACDWTLAKTCAIVSNFMRSLCSSAIGSTALAR